MYKDQTLAKYLDQLAAREPIPGGGSAAALVGALGVALIAKVARYSKDKSQSKALNKKIRQICIKSEKIEKRLLKLVDLDAKAYLRVTQTRKSSLKIRRSALKKAREVPHEVSHLCYEAIKLTPVLVKKGNPYLLSDIQVAVELLVASFDAGVINVEVNQ